MHLTCQAAGAPSQTSLCCQRHLLLSASHTSPAANDSHKSSRQGHQARAFHGHGTWTLLEAQVGTAGMHACATKPPLEASQDTAYSMLEKEVCPVCVLNEHILSSMCVCAVAVLYGSNVGLCHTLLYTDVHVEPCVISRTTCDVDPSSAWSVASCLSKLTLCKPCWKGYFTEGDSLFASEMRC